jgi:hypothetical protein
LVKAAKGSLSVELFCDILSRVAYCALMSGYKPCNPAPPWMNSRRELKRMANDTGEIKRRLSQMVERLVMVNMGSRKNNKIYRAPDETYLIKLFATGFVEENPGLSDQEFISALDVVAKYWAAVSAPRPSHRPEDFYMTFFLYDMEKICRESFSKPHHPVIAMLAQIVSDVRDQTNGKTPKDLWTAPRVTTALKRHHKKMGS